MNYLICINCGLIQNSLRLTDQQELLLQILYQSRSYLKKKKKKATKKQTTKSHIPKPLYVLCCLLRLSYRVLIFPSNWNTNLDKPKSLHLIRLVYFPQKLLAPIYCLLMCGTHKYQILPQRWARASWNCMRVAWRKALRVAHVKTARKGESDEFVGIPLVSALRQITCLNSLVPLILGLTGCDLCAWQMLHCSGTSE